MNRKFLLLPAALLAGSLTALIALNASSASAQGTREQQACLQNNRIYGWTVVNERALIVNDIYGRRFSVDLSSGCVGLTNATLALRFLTTTDLGCLMRGDRISFRAPVLGPMSCFVNDVQPLAGRARGGYLNPNDDTDGGASDRGSYLNR
jgi:Family of unknown function (DUF6491)